MNMNSCPHCTPEERKRLSFMCEFETSDGLALRCCGPQMIKKLELLRYYFEIFDTAMRDKFERLNFVDLFAGSGMCRDRQTGTEKYGSALLAYTLRFGFTNYVFNDLDEETTRILYKRCCKIDHRRLERVQFLNHDANSDIDKILKHVPRKNSLTVVLIDPNGLDISFETIRELAGYHHLDLIINYAVLDLKRNRMNYELGENCKADKFFGAVDWKTLPPQETYLAYKKQIHDVGMTFVEDDFVGTQRIQTTNNADVYYLMFASKKELGLKFWREARKKHSEPGLFN